MCNEKAFRTFGTASDVGRATTLPHGGRADLADHWCQRGHILYVVEGELETELESGDRVTLKPGMSYQVSDGRSSHRSATMTGVKLFIVD